MPKKSFPRKNAQNKIREKISSILPMLSTDIWRNIHLLDPIKSAPVKEEKTIFDILPKAHQELLEQSNGLMGLNGGYRLFSINNPEIKNIIDWNDKETWKFAWQGSVAEQLQDYLCFGEDIIGDQYTYRLSELSSGNSKIYTLFSATMDPITEHDSFQDFMKSFASGNSVYHLRIIEAMKELGTCDPNDHLMYAPPPLLVGGRTDLEGQSLQLIKDNKAMILNGDIFSQMCTEENTGTVKGLEPYVDEKGRDRLKVLWEEDT